MSFDVVKSGTKKINNATNKSDMYVIVYVPNREIHVNMCIAFPVSVHDAGWLNRMAKATVTTICNATHIRTIRVIRLKKTEETEKI